MKFQQVILLAILNTLVMTGDTSSTCKLAPDFGAVGNQPVGLMPNTTKFCKTVNKTCCSQEDFEIMNSIWADSKNPDNLRSLRTRQMRETLNIVKYLEEAEKKLIELSLIIKEGKNADPACSTPAYIQRQLYKLNVAQTSINQYHITSKQCWEYTKNLMNGLMCAACDADAQDFIDKKNKQLLITQAECDNFIAHCGEHLKSVKAFHFYFNVYSRLTYCDLNGKFNLDLTPEFNNFPKKDHEALNGCMNSKRKDDCIQICKSQLGFTTMTNYESNHLQNITNHKTMIENYINKEKAKIEKELKEKNLTLKKVTLYRRILEDPKPAKMTVNQTMELINNYSINITLKGLNLFAYTKDNMDGFADIDLKDVRSKGKVIAMISLWILLFLYS